MANDQNLLHGNPDTQFRSGREAVENGQKGGIASGESRREKSTIKKLLCDFLEQPSENNAELKELAEKLGIESPKSIKELFTIVCTINTLKSGRLYDLEKLASLIGENREDENEDVMNKLDEVLGGIDALANE